jgi:hypothetical protein
MENTLANDSTNTLVFALPNESTLTLVAPAPSSVHTFLILSADSILNTTFAANNMPVYKVKTTGTSTRTELVRCDGDEVIASVDRRLLGDVVIRPSGEKVKINKWARFVKFNVYVVFLFFVARMLRDLGFQRGHRIHSSSRVHIGRHLIRLGSELPRPDGGKSHTSVFLSPVFVLIRIQCFEQGVFAKPLAWFEPSKNPLRGSATVSPATMALDDGAPEVSDIVISWMVFKERVHMHAVRTAPRPRNGLQVGRF